MFCSVLMHRPCLAKPVCFLSQELDIKGPSHRAGFPACPSLDRARRPNTVAPGTDRAHGPSFLFCPRLVRQMQKDFSAVRLIAMFEQVQALPGPKPHPASDNRDADRGLVQGGLDMRGHVVWPFHRVP